MKNIVDALTGCLGIFLWTVPLLGMMAAVVALVIHVVTCITTSSWILLILGVLAAPVGIIHGFMIWFGII